VAPLLERLFHSYKTITADKKTKSGTKFDFEIDFVFLDLFSLEPHCFSKVAGD
jgi:hypothetical protein